jgi:hypothetical protein
MCKELAVRPAFPDFAVMQYENLARTDDRAESVRDRDRGPSAHEHLERLLDRRFDLAVDRTGGFVENEKRGIRRNGARERQQLTLSYTHRRATLAKLVS